MLSGTHRLRALLGFIAIWGVTLGSQAALAEPGHGVRDDASSHAAHGPLTVIEQSTTDVVVRIDAPKPQLASVAIAGRPFVRATMPGFDLPSEEGVPEVPFVRAEIAVPVGHAVSFSVSEITGRGGLRLDHPLAYRETLPLHNGKTNPARQDEAAYQRTHGDALVVIDEVSFAGATKLAQVRFFPMRYAAQSGELSWVGSYKIKFHFTPFAALGSEKAPVARADHDVARFVAINELAWSDDDNHRAASLVDLIIAHESHREALQRLIGFKKELGRTVREIYVDGKRAQEIKDLIAREYASAEPPATTMLVGNIDQIPSWRGSSDNTWTDYNYTLLDQGSAPDIALGRVPAHSAAELNAFIDKAMARELDNRRVDDVLLTAGRDQRLGCPANVTRVGEKILPAGPAVNVIRKYRSNGVSTDEVFAAYNAEPNLIVYDGHGDRYGMQEIPLLMSNLSGLTNRTFPIILDIACLNASWYRGATARNFAESILFQEGAGAAGILASGGSGNGHEFFQSIAALMATGRKTLLTEGYATLNEIGQVILAAKIRHGYQDRSFWNYYGDPAASVWEAASSLP